MTSFRYALALSASYLAISVVYILVSTEYAAMLAHNVTSLRDVELVKGISFVVVTSIGLLAFSHRLFRRMERFSSRLADAQAALLANERRITAGVMAASVAHDANNALTVALTNLSLVRSTSADSEGLADLAAALGRLVELNQRLLHAGRSTVEGGTEVLDLAAVVKRLLHDIRSHPALARCRIHVVMQEGLTVEANMVLLHQIASNLVINAGEAMGGNGEIEIRGYPQGADLCLEVHDAGPGVPVERRPTLFAALKTTKPNGSGLGLFSVKACVSELRGRIEVANSHRGGACFRVTLPSRRPREPAPVPVQGAAGQAP